MPIDHFTREEFEAALPVSPLNGQRLWVPGDWAFYQPGCRYRPESSFVVNGEYTYSMPVLARNISSAVYVAIRSSVKSDGHSADVGEDSIRLWLMKADEWGGGPVASKLTKYITRVKGWDKRMTQQLRTLYKVGLALKPCPKCGELMHAKRAKKSNNSENIGRLFQSCMRPNARGKGQHGCKGSFEWIEFKEDKR